MATAIAGLETVVTVVFTNDIPTELEPVRGGEYVLFRFPGQGNYRVDLNISYPLLDRLRDLVTEAIQVYAMGDNAPPADAPELV